MKIEKHFEQRRLYTGYICARSINLSKAFDTRNNNLLIAKLGAYGFDTKSLYYIKIYLDNRKQRVHVYKNVSWAKVTAGVPQVSILGSLLFNIFVNDLFLFVSSSELSNCDDDNTLYASGYNLEEVKPVSLNDLNKVTELFFLYYMVLNTGKYHFMCLGKNTENGIFIFKDTIMNNSKDENNTRCYYRQYTDF